LGITVAGAAERGAQAGAQVGGLAAPAWIEAPLSRWGAATWAMGIAAVAAGLHLAFWGAATPLGSAPVPGALLAAAGLAWAVWAWARFRVAGLPLDAGDTPLQLIEEGPYRYSRHPMYLGVTAALLGTAMALGLPLLLVGAVLFAAIVHTVHIPREEAQLARRFGGWWRDYAGDVRRWL
jgi:protein-S-isoprenylcysteine O-methyltransferase Ste14